MIPVQLPFKGFTEQNSYSSVPEGMTPSCLNVMPVDVFNGRTRIGTRQGSKRWDTTGVQFLGSYRIYEGTNLVERLIMVRAGKVYYGDPQSSTPSWTLMSNQATAKLNTTGIVRGVQYSDAFFFVDGTNYAEAHLDDPTGTSGSVSGVTQWGDTSGGGTGPYGTDPNGAAAGDRATLIVKWGARLVLSGYKIAPTIWFACAPDLPYSIHGGSSTDGWNPANGGIGAIGGTTGTDAFGSVGDPIVAIFPFGQTGLMFACTNSFEYMTSDPEFDASAQIVRLTKSIGIAGPNAWCFGQEKAAYVLANDGLYYLTPNDFNFNRGSRISAGRLDSFFLRLDFGAPVIGGSGVLAGGTLRSIGSGSGASKVILDANKNIDPSPSTGEISAAEVAESLVGGLTNGEVYPTLVWDEDREGLWILLTVSGSEQQSIHMYYDVKTDSFWPQRLADPNMYGPTNALYVGSSRSKLGKLFLASADGISIIDRGYPIGIDGYTAGMTDTQKRTQFVRNSLTVGPIIAPLAQRMLLQEVRVDLAEDQYEVPSTETDPSTPPILSVSKGDTAQGAIGLRSDALFVSQLNELVVDGEDRTPPASFISYDGGSRDATAQNRRVDGRFATRPFGVYTKANPFTSGTAAVYDGPSDYTLEYTSSAWRIVWEGEIADETEYEKQNGDPSTPNGQLANMIQNPPPTDKGDIAEVSGASFSDAEIIEIGELNVGRNEAIKARVRSEAMYLTIASDGRPWSVERMSVLLSQVGKSRGAT
jgi:hypothetical protein